MRSSHSPGGREAGHVVTPGCFRPSRFAAVFTGKDNVLGVVFCLDYVKCMREFAHGETERTRNMSAMFEHFTVYSNDFGLF